MKKPLLFATLAFTLLLALSLSAHASCLGDAQAELLRCRKGCLSFWNTDRMYACEYGCNADYYRAKRRCGVPDEKLALVFPAASNPDDCQFVRGEDGRQRVFCAANGVTYSTWGQCRTYCR